MGGKREEVILKNILSNTHYCLVFFSEIRLCEYAPSCSHPSGESSGLYNLLPDAIRQTQCHIIQHLKDCLKSQQHIVLERCTQLVLYPPLLATQDKALVYFCPALQALPTCMYTHISLADLHITNWGSRNHQAPPT